MVVTLMICLPWFLSSYTLCSLLLSCSCFLSLLGLSGMPVSLYLDQDLWSWAMLILLFWVFLFSMATDLRSVPNKLGGVIGLLLSVLVLVFMVASPTSMYIAFESSLLPMTLAVLGLGAQPERLSGSLYLWIYTIAASVPYFMIVLNSWSLWLFFLHGDIGAREEISNTATSLLVLSFLAKAPIYGLHLWLPQTHVEASAFGSSILAGILLKVGILGLIRVSGFLPVSMIPTLLVLSLLGGSISSFMAICQTDIKSLIAYSSVTHMAVSLCGALAANIYGSFSSLLMVIGHGAVSSGMFSMATVLYSTSGTRTLLVNTGGLLSQSILSNSWSVILLLNISVPPYMSFVSELIFSKVIISSSVYLYSYILILMMGSLVLSLILFSSFSHGSSFSKYPLVSSTLKDATLGLIVLSTLSIGVLSFMGVGV